jgi:hypothetical protein
VIVSTLAVALPYPAAASLLTVTGRLVPIVAAADTVIVAMIVVELTAVKVENVTPLGPVSLAPGAKPVPLMVTCPVLP